MNSCWQLSFLVSQQKDFPNSKEYSNPSPPIPQAFNFYPANTHSDLALLARLNRHLQFGLVFYDLAGFLFFNWRSSQGDSPSPPRLVRIKRRAVSVGFLSWAASDWARVQCATLQTSKARKLTLLSVLPACKAKAAKRLSGLACCRGSSRRCP